MQIKVYSYSKAGDKPLTWDKDMKGSVVDDYDYYYDQFKVAKNGIRFINLSMDFHTFVNLSLGEYVLVSLCLALVIVKFFPAIHSKFISKAANSLEYQSLYWGSAVVANVFTYGLVFLGGKGMSTSSLCIVVDWYECESSPYVLSISIMLLVVYVILIVGAVIASLRRPRGTDIPIPTGMGKVLINISLCFSCFCFCVCCSPRCRAKTLQVLIMFSFMSFIYHIVMDAISIGFILFIEETRTVYIALTFLYISLIIFIIILTSFSLYLVFRSGDQPFYKQLRNCFGGSFMVVTVFGSVMLLVVMYMIIFFSLKLTGVTGIIAGLIPSIALSAASWYIKKKLLKEQPNNSSTTSVQSDHGATDLEYRESALNDGDMKILSSGSDSSTEEQGMPLP